MLAALLVWGIPALVAILAISVWLIQHGRHPETSRLVDLHYWNW